MISLKQLIYLKYFVRAAGSLCSDCSEKQSFGKVLVILVDTGYDGGSAL